MIEMILPPVVNPTDLWRPREPEDSDSHWRRYDRYNADTEVGKELVCWLDIPDISHISGRDWHPHDFALQQSTDHAAGFAHAQRLFNLGISEQWEDFNLYFLGTEWICRQGCCQLFPLILGQVTLNVHGVLSRTWSYCHGWNKRGESRFDPHKWQESFNVLWSKKIAIVRYKISLPVIQTTDEG